MNNIDAFPNTIEEFLEQYKIVDNEKVYSNGIELIPIFRIKQWLESYNPEISIYKGSWKHLYDDNYICSVCGAWYRADIDALNDFNYCPNCGSKMNGSEKDE